MGRWREGRWGAGDARAGDGKRARARAQAAVRAWADDPQDRMLADEMRAVVDVADDGDGAGGGVGVGERSGVPGAVQHAATAEKAGEKGADQGLDGMAQARVRGAVPLERVGGLALGGGAPAGGWVNY